MARPTASQAVGVPGLEADADGNQRGAGGEDQAGGSLHGREDSLRRRPAALRFRPRGSSPAAEATDLKSVQRGFESRLPYPAPGTGSSSKAACTIADTPVRIEGSGSGAKPAVWMPGSGGAPSSREARHSPRSVTPSQ